MQAQYGHLLYFHITSFYNIKAHVMIGSSLVDPNLITCEAQPGDMLAAVYPAKFFVTFESTQSNGSNFLFVAKYRSSSDGVAIDNAQRCSDKGASVTTV